MNSRSLLILVTAVLALAAVLYWQGDDSGPAEQQAVLPGLAPVLNDVQRVTVIGAGNTKIATLERGEHHWRLTERGGYPADVGRLRSNLIALAEAKIVEPKTADAALHARLGVEDLTDPAATGKEFVIETPSESFRLIVGKRGVRGGMSYVRRPEENQSFLVSADLDPGEDATDWLRRDVLDIGADRIRSITITHPDDGEVLRIERTAAEVAQFSVVDMPEGRELQYATILNSLTGVLAGLNLDDVTAAGDVADDEPPVTARFETVDGLVVEARVRDTADGPRVLFSVSADGGNDEAARLEAKLAGWAYTLPSYKVDQLTRRLEELLKSAD